MKIEFVCDDETVAKTFPPVPASMCIPDWYKKLDFYTYGYKPIAKDYTEKNVRNHITIRGCAPVQDYMLTGYVIRAHADIAITPEQFGDMHGWWYKSGYGDCIPHPYEQCPVEMGKGKNTYLKIVSPWRVKTPKGYSCMFYQPFYELENRFSLFPAVVDSDGYNEHPVNFPGVVLAKDSFVIKAGTPLMIVVPFKRESWTHSISSATRAQVNAALIFLERGYKILFHKKKVFK